jgi:sigma-B regulation protein RsbU (phosphoserine phosphatase)
MSELDTILLVDDNPTNLEVLYQTLDRPEFKLLVATNGEDAIKIAQKALPDLILLDIMMPGISGFEVCETLKADPQTARCSVIFLSALDETRDKVRGLELGAVDYVTKPFQVEEVIARVQTQLRVKRLDRQLSQRNAELTEANRRMKEDIEAAARVQRALLPERLPDHGRYRFAFRYLPCDELAGDALNVFSINADHLGVYLLDVSGHGVPSALLSVSATRSLMRDWNAEHTVDISTDARLQPAALAEALNRNFPMAVNGNHFFTLLFGVIDMTSAMCRMVSAGHPAPILVRNGEPACLLEVGGGVPIGIMDDASYHDSQLQLMVRDRLYFLSDGLYEQRNEQREAFGMDRVIDTFSTASSMTLDESLERVLHLVDDWRGKRRYGDDISIVALEVT